MPKNRVFRENDIDTIVDLIRTWPNDTISWIDVCKKSGPVLGFVPSRQGLCQHKCILAAFQAKKQRLRISPKEASPTPSSLAVAGQRIAALNAKIIELSRENAFLRDRFITWQYNAHTRNMTQEDLDKPLVEIDREVDESEKDEHGRRK